MTNEQVANLRIGDEIWLAKFKLGYDTATHKITALINYHPKKFIIRRYLCDADFNITGYETESGRCYHRFDVKNLIDEAVEFIKYATSEKEITEWYENRKREQKGEYLKQLEEATKELGEI